MAYYMLCDCQCAFSSFIEVNCASTQAQRNERESIRQKLALGSFYDDGPVIFTGCSKSSKNCLSSRSVCTCDQWLDVVSYIMLIVFFVYNCIDWEGKAILVNNDDNIFKFF